MSFGRDNPQCVQIINVAVSVVTGYITEEENMYRDREHSVMDYSISVELLTYWSDEVRSGRELNCTLD